MKNNLHLIHWCKNKCDVYSEFCATHEWDGVEARSRKKHIFLNSLIDNK